MLITQSNIKNHEGRSMGEERRHLKPLLIFTQQAPHDREAESMAQIPWLNLITFYHKGVMGKIDMFLSI